MSKLSLSIVDKIGKLRSSTTDLKELLAEAPIMRPVLKGLLPSQVRSSDILFVHIPRNAGTAVSEALYGRSWPHHTTDYYRRVFGKRFYQMFKFSILRDPVDRCVSAYFFTKNGGADQVRLSPYWRSMTDHISSFSDYLEFLSENRHKLNGLDFVMRTQTHFIIDATNNVLTDRLFLLGRDDVELKALLSSLGAFNLGHSNRSRKVNISISIQEINLIRELYAEDYRLIDTVMP